MIKKDNAPENLPLGLKPDLRMYLLSLAKANGK